MLRNTPTFPYWRLSAYYFAYFAFIGVFVPYFALYLKSLALSAWDIGLIMTQMQLMRLVGPYAWGMLADRGGRHLAIVRLTSAAAAFVFLGFFWSTRLEAFLFAMAALSLFWVAALPLVETITFDHLRENPARYGRVRIWGSIGYIVAVTATGAALDHLPLVALLWFGLVALLAIVGSAFALPGAVAHHAPAPAPALSAVLGQARVRALFAACVAMSAAHAALNIFYAILLADHGYSKTLTGALLTLGVLAEIGVFYGMAPMMRRFSLREILLACFVAAAVRFAAIGCFVDSLLVLVVAQLLHGLTFGAFHAAAIAAVNRWFTGANRGRGQALYSSLSFGAGGLLGGLVSGWSWDALGGAATFVGGSLFAVFGGLLVAFWVRDARPEISVEAGLASGRGS